MDNKLSELKAAAMAATPGPWILDDDSWSEGDNANVSTEERYDGRIVSIAQIEGGGSESGFDEPFSTEQQANARYITAANPAVIIALLAELEFEKQNNAGVAGMVEDYETKLEAKDKSIAELEAEAKVWESAATKHLARAEEAEKRLAKPVRLQSPWVDKAGNRWLLEGTTADVIRASGFAVTVEGGCVG